MALACEAARIAWPARLVPDVMVGSGSTSPQANSSSEADHRQHSTVVRLTDPSGRCAPTTKGPVSSHRIAIRAEMDYDRW